MTSAVAHRIDLSQASPNAFAALHELATAAAAEAAAAGLEPRLLELVRLRTSQLNGCAYCLDLHSRAARAAGESEQRLHLLPAWRESALFTPRERTALSLAESLTTVATTPLPDDVHAAALHEFGEAQYAQLTWAITIVNAYNRIALATRAARP
jgi:AhpD family alkylhydroperoxidase